MEYKNTLNLPKTDFPMKADLPKREPEMLSGWYASDMYRQISEKPAKKGRYILHDGPPYANGDIHIGHALNKTLKDMVVKYKTMQGFASAYIPGWDCHGLPIEHQLFKELKISKYQISQLEFRKKAHEYAMRYVAIQKEQFKRLGIFADWENPYLTLSHEYEEAIVSSFNELFKKGFIQRGLKPVNWCFKCETALAEAEVEYEDHTSPSVFVKFKLDNSPEFANDTFLLIWTTTPWTLIANVAVAVHPDFAYCLVRTDRGAMIIAESLLGKVLAQAGIEKFEVTKTFKGKTLEGLVYSHPFGLRKGKVVLADYVSSDDGSGLVHTAPGHGAEDYLTGLKYNLEIVMPVDSRGKFDQSAGEFAGMNVYDANKAIIEKLKTIDSLLFDAKMQHSYPHCWRCKNPIIFRATNQWFLMIDRHNLRKNVLQAIRDSVQWIPPAGRERILSMVETRPDWCLSRQRYWGVPVPSLVCVKCKHEFFDSAVIEKFASHVSEEGSDCWFERDVKDFLHAGVACPACGEKEFSKGADILDVWFDSGVSSQAVLKKREALGKEIPCALYLEGSDQHRGWFQSSLIPSMAIEGIPPFKSVLTHGFVVDGDGRKMSKSQGNVVSPQSIIKDYGADILRLWVASSDYNEDIRISKEILSRLSEAYRKIRNTARFILSNLYDFNPETDTVDCKDLRKIDAWILSGLQNVVHLVSEANDRFEFSRAYKGIYDFCNEDLSMRYLDMVKGRLYTCAAGSAERRSAQTAMYEVLHTVVKLMAPILSFTAEEIWQHLPKKVSEASMRSVHLLDWPQENPLYARHEGGDFGVNSIEQEFAPLFSLIPEMAKLLEAMRSQGAIGSSFDAQINLLTNNSDRYTFLSDLKNDLCEIFKVSLVTVELCDSFPESVLRPTDPGDIGVRALAAGGKKCVRCWNYSSTVGEHASHVEICETCLKAIGGK